MDKISDEKLVSLSLEKQDYFAELIDRYESKLLRYIRRLVNVNHETAEDILQEVFIKVYRNLNDFDQSLKFSSWIYRITHNEAISYYRANQKKEVSVSIDKDNGLVNILKSSLETDKEVVDKEIVVKIKEVLDCLPEKYRDVLVLKYLEEKDYEEIGDILRIPVGTVGTLLSRGKVEFRKLALVRKMNELI